jgi:hypothetical protein
VLSLLQTGPQILNHTPTQPLRHLIILHLQLLHPLNPQQRYRRLHFLLRNISQALPGSGNGFPAVFQERSGLRLVAVRRGWRDRGVRRVACRAWRHPRFGSLLWRLGGWLGCGAIGWLISSRIYHILVCKYVSLGVEICSAVMGSGLVLLMPL